MRRIGCDTELHQAPRLEALPGDGGGDEEYSPMTGATRTAWGWAWAASWRVSSQAQDKDVATARAADAMASELPVLDVDSLPA